MPRIKGFDEIENEIAKHKATKAQDEWANLSRIFIDIYQRNRNELIYLLEEPSRNDELSIELFQNVRPPVIKNSYTNEVLRSIFNYLSSLSSLVDAGIRLTGKYTNSEMHEYNIAKIALIGSDINAFFGKFRNYIQHYGIPPIGWIIRLNEDRTNDCTYFLSKDKLLEWGHWGSKAKAFIATSDLNLLESINAHGKMIDEAYGSLLPLFTVIHGKDVDDVNLLIRKRNDMLSGKVPIVDV